MRLTEIIKVNGEEYVSIKGTKGVYVNAERKGAPASNAIVRLAAYEDAEEQGRLVPVVRCGECKHSAIDFENMRYCKLVTYYNHVLDDWFCADGARMDMVTDCNQVKDSDA